MAVRVSLTEHVTIEARGVLVDEQRFPGRQGRLVFAYLLASAGRPVSRDELAEALWGDELPATWEKGLSVLVSKLRALLNDCGLDGARSLTSAFGCYQLVLPPGTWIDVVVADESATAAERALAAGELEQARVDASAAASLARRTFLPGEHGRWVEDERAGLRETLVRALDSLAEVHRRSGDSAAAIRAAEELVALEPFRETGYRRLMEAHIAAGNRAEALRVYEQCRRLLADELGTYPSPETESIYRGLLEAPSGSGSAPWRPRRRHSRRSRSPPRRVRSKRPTARMAAVTLTLAAVAGGGRGHPRDRGPASSAAAAVRGELDRRPRRVGVDRGNRSGGRPAGRDRVERRRAVGREPGRPERHESRPVVRPSGAQRRDRRHADGNRRDQDSRLGDPGLGRAVEDRPEVRPPELLASRPCLGGVLRRNGAARAGRVRLALDRQPRRRPLASRPRFRTSQRLRRRRKRSVGDRLRRGLAVGDEQLGRDGHAHRPGDARARRRSRSATGPPRSPSTRQAHGSQTPATTRSCVSISGRTPSPGRRRSATGRRPCSPRPARSGWRTVATAPSCVSIRAPGRSRRRSGSAARRTRSRLPAGRSGSRSHRHLRSRRRRKALRLTTQYDFTSLDPAHGSWLHHATCANLVTYPDKPAPRGRASSPRSPRRFPSRRPPGRSTRSGSAPASASRRRRTRWSPRRPSSRRSSG